MQQSDRDAGITQYLGCHQSISAVVKAQISDFVVNEVTRDGTVVRLSSTSLPKVETCSAGDENVPDIKPPNTKEEWDSACERLEKELAGTDAAKLNVSAAIREFAREPAPDAPVGSDSSAPPSLVLPPLTEKSARKAVHAWVKISAPGLITDTIEGDAGAGCIRIRRLDACRPWKRRRTDSNRDRDAPQKANEDAALDTTYDPRESLARGNGRGGRGGRGAGGRGRRYDPNFVDRRTFVQFVLWKEGKDTVYALSDIAKRLRMSVDDLSHAGTKDKRGITTQRIRVRGVPLQRLLSLNQGFRRYGPQKMAIGNVEVLPRDKSHRLDLGDLGGNRFTIALRELDLKEGSTENLMAAVDSVRTRGFVNYFGLQRFGRGAYGTHEIGYCVLRGDFHEACKRLLTPVVIDGVAEGLAELRDDRRRSDNALREFESGTVKATGLLNALPRWMNIERSVVESYARDEKRGVQHDHKSAFGQVPRTMRKMYGHAVQSYLWNFMASKRLEMSRGQFAAAGDLILCDEKAGRDVTLSSSTPVRSVSEAESDSCSIPLERVLIPMIGSKVPVPNNAVGKAAKKILAEERIDFAHVPSDYDLVGTYRWLLACPKDVSVSLVTYKDPLERIIPSDVDAFVQGRGNHKREQEQGLPKESQPSLGDNDCDPNCESSASGTRAALQGAVLGFTLGPAEYATMLIRELLRQDSSIANQKAQEQSARRREQATEKHVDSCVLDNSTETPVQCT